MADTIDEIQEFIIRKDILDIRSIQYIFESNGVQFFSDIPLKYQILLLKNLNKLIKNKSTTQNIIDICSIFGLDNAQVYKYYLIKTYEDEDNPSLKFLKMPAFNEDKEIDDIDNYIHDSSNYVEYDEMTSFDDSWAGTDTEEISEVKQSITDEDFAYVRSKYISIESITDFTKKSLQNIYFMISYIY